MENEKSCPICNSPNGKIAYKKEKEGVFWIRCGECSLVYKRVEKTGANTDASYYRSGQMRETLPPRYGDPTSVTPEISFMEKYEIQWERYLKVKEYIKHDSSVLEIGCGSGGFLYTLNPMVRECVGVELDRELVDYCKNKLNLDVRGVPLNEANLDAGQFDLICMFHVLEHFQDPGGFLAQVTKHLKPGGKLVIEVPCYNDALVQVFDLKKYPEIYFTIHHDLFFTEESLARLIDACGLECQLLPFNQYGLANHLNWLQNDSPVLGGSRQSGRCFQVSSYKDKKNNRDLITDVNHWLKQVNEEYRELLGSHDVYDTIFCVAQKI